MENDVKIPSVISYSPTSEAQEQQLGADLSPNAVAMIDIKIQLEAQDNRLDELDLVIQVLEGTKNLNFADIQQAQGITEYTTKSPEIIVTDYLEKAFSHFQRGTEYLSVIKDNNPVDIIVTVPVVCVPPCSRDRCVVKSHSDRKLIPLQAWSYRAKNSTFKAIRNAGFSSDNFPKAVNYYLVTEPEAAALYTARSLKEEEAEELRVD